MNNFKNLIYFVLILIVCCKKKDDTLSGGIPVEDNYTSMNDFFSKNGAVMQTYTVNASTGGSFTSPQGTVVNIPANAFVTQAGVTVTGKVMIQFKDIYKKSDMVLSDLATTAMWTPVPLKSGGEFFIKAVLDGTGLLMAPGKNISVIQPANLTGGIDSLDGMQPFVRRDTFMVNVGWNPSFYDDTLFIGVNNYIFNLYQFKYPADSGTWCNSDAYGYFAGFTQTNLTIHPDDSIQAYHTQVFLIFKNVTSMVHVYDDGKDFIYNYAPTGLSCTVVSIGIKDGKLYSSFVPITISTNQVVNFSLSPTTTAEFKAQLKALD